MNKKNLTRVLIIIFSLILLFAACTRKTSTEPTKVPSDTQNPNTPTQTASTGPTDSPAATNDEPTVSLTPSPEVSTAPAPTPTPTQKPTTQKPTTQKPTTQKPTTQKPTTQKPTTQHPATTQPPATTEPTPTLYKPAPNVARSRIVFKEFNQSATIYVLNPGAMVNLKGVNGLTIDEKLLLQSLQGIVAQRKAEIFIGSPTDRWLKYLRQNYGVKIDDGKYIYYGDTGKVESKTSYLTNIKDLINHYIQSGDIQGYVKMKYIEGKYNPIKSQVNQACTLSGINRWLVVSTGITGDLATACPSLNLGFDLSVTTMSEYDVFKANASKLNLNMLIMQAPPRVETLREYGIASKAGFFFYSSNTPNTEKDYVYTRLNPLAISFGWQQVDVTEDGIAIGNSEDASVDFAADRDVSIMAADWCSNLSIWSSLPSEKLTQKPTAKLSQTGEQIHYMTLLFSDGDNIQWMQNSFPIQYFGGVRPEKKVLPFGWTMTPNLIETMPHIVKYLYQNMTDKEHFVASVSGYAYNHPARFTDSALNKYAIDTGKMMQDAGISYLAMKGSDERVFNSFAAQSPIKGGFIMYGAWSNKPGYIYWQNNKPFVNDRLIFWQKSGDWSDPKYISQNITKLGHFSKDPKKAGAYTFVQVHCWSYNYSTLQKVFYEGLNKTNVKVVPPNEFMELIKKNLTPNNGHYTIP